VGEGEREMNFDTSKNLSGIGALLLVVAAVGSTVPYLGLVGLIGLILLLIGLKGLADVYNEQGIFNNALYSIIIAIVGAVVAVATVAITAVSALATIGLNLGNIEDWANIGTDLGAYFTDFANFSQLWTIISAVVIGLVVLFVFAIIAMLFLRKSMNQLSSKSGVGLFGTAGLLMLIGAVLTIIAIGAILIWIGFILATVAFFKMKAPST
jgi:uncharacterized membrane protein